MPSCPELADRKVLKSLEGPVEDTVPARRPITTRDLLTFTFGMGAVDGVPAQVSDPEGRRRRGRQPRTRPVSADDLRPTNS
jgi:hypothetical protein